MIDAHHYSISAVADLDKGQNVTSIQQITLSGRKSLACPDFSHAPNRKSETANEI
jgi:hypothetical protein